MSKERKAKDRKEHKLDFGGVLNAVDRRDINWLARQPEATQAGFGLQHLRMASCVQQGMSAAYMLWAVNHRVNLRFFDLHKDHDLSFRLLATCGLERRVDRTWIAARRASHENSALELLAEQAPLANDAELRMLLRQYDRAEFEEYVQQCGTQPDDVAPLMRSFDKVARD